MKAVAEKTQMPYPSVKWIFVGLGWPFVLAAFLTYIKFHRYVPEYFFWFAVLPIMSLGLLPLMIRIAKGLQNRYTKFKVWCISIAFSLFLGIGLFGLVILFMVFFHFAIGGTC